MPFFAHDDTTIYFEERGAGPALLLIAPGGMHSRIEYWAAAAINPWEAYREDFRLVAMDQRNAGQSRAPLDVGSRSASTTPMFSSSTRSAALGAMSW